MAIFLGNKTGAAPTSMPLKDILFHDGAFSEIQYAIGCDPIPYLYGDYGYTSTVLLNVNGTGIVNFLAFGGGSTSYADMQVEIDGVELYDASENGTGKSLIAYGLAAIGGYFFRHSGDGADGPTLMTQPVPFNQNIKVT